MIRTMVIDDIFSVVALENKVFKETLGASFFDQELTLNPFALYYVIELHKEIIGYIGLRIYDNNCEVMNFAINREYQRQGYGQMLFDYVLEELKKRNVNLISLEVRKNNKQALNFYYKNEFYKDHVRKNYYNNNEDALVLLRDVKNDNISD